MRRRVSKRRRDSKAALSSEVARAAGLVEVADVVGRAGYPAQLPDSRGRFVARSDDPIEVGHGRMIRCEFAKGKLGAAADQDDVGAQVAGDAARRCDHSLMVSATETRSPYADEPITLRSQVSALALSTH